MAQQDYPKQTVSYIYKICIIDFFEIYLIFMKKSNIPETRVKNPEPNINSSDWVIQAAWAD